MTTGHPPTDLPPPELFPSIELEHQREIQRTEEIVSVHKRAIALADSLIGMASTEGYKRFVGCIDEIKQANYARMMKAKTDREATLLIGACQALDDILVLTMNTANNRARLAGTLQRAEDHLAKLRNPEKREPL